MNGSAASLTDLTAHLVSSELDANVDVVIAPPACYIAKLAQQKTGSKLSISAQNVHEAGSGAFTGEMSCSMAVDCGAEYVILGHSERRHVFNESNEQIGKKTGAALAAGLKVIACIGETETQREEGSTMSVCIEQMQSFVANIKDWSNVVIAYEPVWAIGTGKVATPEIAQEVHHDLRAWISANVTPEVAESVCIIYGGSVKGSNCKNLASQADIDGFLVGGASLKPEFVEIINANN